MQFTSITFYLYFLPVFLLLFRLVSKSTRLSFLAKIVLIIGTYFFYGFENTSFLIPFIFATLLDLLWAVLLDSCPPSATRRRRLIVAASVVQNLSLFFIFKYLNAVAATFPHVTELQTLQHAFADQNGLIALPPGISFYLFESLSFVIDCYRRTIRVPKNPFNFLVFISMFPRFIAGPIVRYADLEDAIHHYRGMRVGDGLVLFQIGFIIKILLADSLVPLVSLSFAHNYFFYPSWLAAIAYTFQLYLDFSAYSLMAIGLGLMIGFPFLDNFREPYISQNITEFWRRWHISLSSWLRDYVYIPLGGSRGPLWRTNLNLFLTMLIGGIWHGAHLTFLIWGIYHGALLVLERQARKFGFALNSKAATFFLVLIGWVVFKADNFLQVAQMFRGMLGQFGSGRYVLRDFVLHNQLFLLLSFIGVLWALIFEPAVRRRREQKPWAALRLSLVPWPVLSVLFALFVLAVSMSLSARTIPFLYFQF
jgi:alginate O-acetyltransferase complex protein AlgI